MGLRVSQPMVKLSEYTIDDSDGNPMLKSHAYQAVNDGVVYANVILITGNDNLDIFVGLTTDPPTDGRLIQRHSIYTASSNCDVCVTAQVAKGEYFEVRSTTGTVSILWKSQGLALKKPIDFN